MKTPILHLEQFEQTPTQTFYISRLSDHLFTKRNLVHKPHSHSFYLGVLFTQGEGKHEIDFNVYKIQPGSFFLLKPGQTHNWKFDDPPEGIIFFHSKAFFKLNYIQHNFNLFPFYQSNLNPPFLTLNRKETEEINSKLIELKQEFHSNQLFKELQILNSLNSIYIQLSRLYLKDLETSLLKAKPNTKLLTDLERLIETNFKQEKLPRFYAAQLHTTTKNLNRIVQKNLDKTTSDLIAERIVLEAKRLMVHAELSLSEIAYTLGFSDYSYFSRFFKQKSGTSPLQFKNKFLQKSYLS